MDLPSASFHRKRWIIEIGEEQIKIGKSVSDWKSIIDDIDPLDPYSDDDYDAILSVAARANKLLVNEKTVSSGVSAEKLYQTIFKNNPVTWQVSHFFHKPVEYAKEVDYSVLNRLNEITIPVLFIYGKYDLSVPPTSGDDAFDEVSSTHKHWELYERSMHHPFDHQTDLFRIDLLEFLRRYK